MTTYALQDYSGAPAVSESFGGSVIVGLAFKVTSPCWLTGFRYWVADAAQGTAPATFALWQSTTVGGGIGQRGYYVPGTAFTSGNLTLGPNTVMLPAPVPLTASPVIEGYVAAVGPVTRGPQTVSQFGSGQPFSAGIVNGPLQAFSDASGSNPLPNGHAQSPFEGGTDPTTALPSTGFESSNFWVDVIVTDTPPAGATRRLWPSFPQSDPSSGIATPGFFGTVGMQVQASQPCAVQKLWWYSGAGAAVLPFRCGFWDPSARTEITGTDRSPPSWANQAGTTAAPGDGWVWCDYSSSGLVLQPGSPLIAAVGGGDGTSGWRSTVAPYFLGTGPGASGVANGPLSAPAAGASVISDNSWNSGSWGFPGSHDSPDTGEQNWIDVEVSPLGAAPASVPLRAARPPPPRRAAWNGTRSATVNAVPPAQARSRAAVGALVTSSPTVTQG